MERVTRYRPPVFDWLQEHGNVDGTEMYRTFNCGVGMVVCVAEADADKAQAILTEQGETASIIGRIQASEGVTEQVVIS